jgi:hypothetical protein
MNYNKCGYFTFYVINWNKIEIQSEFNLYYIFVHYLHFFFNSINIIKHTGESFLWI